MNYICNKLFQVCAIGIYRNGAESKDIQKGIFILRFLYDITTISMISLI
jgi:hypothetical protein